MVEMGTNNYKMEVLTEWKKDKEGKEENEKEDGDDEEMKQEKKEDMKEEKKEEKAQFHQQESTARLPCSGSSWCNILCVSQQQQSNLSHGGTNANALKSPSKSPQLNGAFQLEENSLGVDSSRSRDLWIPSYNKIPGGLESKSNEDLDEAFKPKQSYKRCKDQKNRRGEDEIGKQEEEEFGCLLYVTEV